MAVCAGSVSFCVVLNYKRKASGKSFWKAYHGQMRSYSGSSIPGSHPPAGRTEGRRGVGRQGLLHPHACLAASVSLGNAPPTPGTHGLPDPRLSPQQVPKADALLVGNCTSPAGGTDGGLTVRPASSLSEGGEDALIPHTHTYACAHVHACMQLTWGMCTHAGEHTCARVRARVHTHEHIHLHVCL